MASLQGRTDGPEEGDIIENIIARTETSFDHNGDPLEVTFYLVGSDHSFSAREFAVGSPTREMLDQIEDLILYGPCGEL